MSTKIELRMSDLERRMDVLEGRRSGYTCVGCRERQPLNYYYYVAKNDSTKETVGPLCAICVWGTHKETATEGWKFSGPYTQPVKLP